MLNCHRQHALVGEKVRLILRWRHSGTAKEGVNVKDIRWTNRFHGADVRNASAASSDANDGWRRFGETARLLGRKKRRVKTTRATCGGCSSSTTGLISVCSTRAAAVVAVLLVVGLARVGMFVVIVRQLGVCVGMATIHQVVFFASVGD